MCSEHLRSVRGKTWELWFIQIVFKQGEKQTEYRVKMKGGDLLLEISEQKKTNREWAYCVCLVYTDITCFERCRRCPLIPIVNMSLSAFWNLCLHVYVIRRHIPDKRVLFHTLVLQFVNWVCEQSASETHNPPCHKLCEQEELDSGSLNILCECKSPFNADI